MGHICCPQILPADLQTLKPLLLPLLKSAEEGYYLTAAGEAQGAKTDAVK